MVLLNVLSQMKKRFHEHKFVLRSDPQGTDFQNLSVQLNIEFLCGGKLGEIHLTRSQVFCPEMNKAYLCGW